MRSVQRRRFVMVAGMVAALAVGSLSGGVAGGSPAPRSQVSVGDYVFVDSVQASAGRSGTQLQDVWTDAYVSVIDPAPYAGAPIVTQELVDGTWVDVASVPGPLTWDSGPVRVTVPNRPSAVTLRVVVPVLGLATPTMTIPGQPASTSSRYYVRKATRGNGGVVVRVFADGSVYGIWWAAQEYSCRAGQLAGRAMTVTDFGHGDPISMAIPTKGSWKKLTVKTPGTRAVGGARRSVTGTNRRMLRLCSAPTYASVTTHPNGFNG